MKRHLLMKLKHSLALFLAAVMVVSMIPETFVYAAENEEAVVVIEETTDSSILTSTTSEGGDVTPGDTEGEDVTPGNSEPDDSGVAEVSSEEVCITEPSVESAGGELVTMDTEKGTVTMAYPSVAEAQYQITYTYSSGNMTMTTFTDMGDNDNDRYVLVIPATVDYTVDGVTSACPVTTIGPKFLQNNAKVQAVTYEEGATLSLIGKEALRGMTVLEEVWLPASLVEIGALAFYNVANLNRMNSDVAGELRLPANLQKINDEAFKNCNTENSFNSIWIPKTLTTTGANNANNGPFQACSNVTKVTIEEGMTTLPASIFGGMSTNDFTIDLPGSLTAIGSYAFQNCSGLTSITVPDSVTEIGTRAFYITGLNRMNSDVDGELRLPANLTKIYSEAFQYSNKENSFSSIWIPKTLNTTGGDNSRNGPFEACPNVTKVTIEEGMTTLPNSIFGGMNTNNFEIKLPESITVIGSYAFQNCSGLTNMTIPTAVTEIGNATFKNSGLVEIYIHKGIVKVNTNAFQNCTALKKVEFEIDESIKTEQKLLDEAFSGCTSLSEVLLSNRIKTIYEKSFAGCTALTEFEVPYGVTKIEAKAFTNCVNLESLYIPSSVTTFGTTEDEFARAYETNTKLYLEKGYSAKEDFTTWDKLIGVYVFADEFPDANFRTELAKQNIDRNLDSRLTNMELREITEISVSDCNIADVKGLTLLIEVESIDCSKNQLSALDIGTLTKLTKINCAENAIEELDVSNNPIVELNCANNKLSKLDVNGKAITTLDCSNNGILAIDLSNAKELTSVVVGEQTGTRSVKRDEVFRDCLLALKEEYDFYNNGYVSEFSDEDGVVTADGIYWKEEYGVPEQLTYTYTVSYGDASRAVSADVTVNVANAGIVFTEKEYPDAALRSKLMEVLDTNKNGYVSKNEERECTTVDISGAGITSLEGLERLVALEELNASGNELTSLDLSANDKLTKLDCSNNKLTSLTVSCNDLLTELNVSNNKLTNLHTSANKNLEKLVCGDNELAAVDFSANKATLKVVLGKQNPVLPIVEDEAAETETYVVDVRAAIGFFDADKVSNVKGYDGDVELSDIESDIQVTENGFKSSYLVDTITYTYTENKVEMQVVLELTNPVFELPAVPMTDYVVHVDDELAIGDSTMIQVEKKPINTTNRRRALYTSSNEEAISVDGKGKVTAYAPGKTTITVSVGGVEKTVEILVYPIDKNSKLVTELDPEVPSYGLPYGEKVTLNLYEDEVSGTVLAPEMFEFSSSNTDLAVVDSTGVITSACTVTKAQTVKITAKLKNDPAERSVTVDVKVIPKQVDEIVFEPALNKFDGAFFDAETNIIYLDAAYNKDAECTFIVESVLKSAGYRVKDTTVKWTTGDKSIATVKAVANSTDVEITLKKGASGICRIAVTANDYKKKTEYIDLYVRDFTPIVSTKSVQVNSYSEAKAVIDIFESYNNALTGAVTVLEYDKTSKSDVTSERFEAQYNEENGQVELTTVYKLDDNGNQAIVKNGSYKVTLQVGTENGNYLIPVTIKVSNKLPTIKVTQKKFNLFYKDSASTIDITVEDANVLGVALADTETFTLEYSQDTNTYKVVYSNPGDPASTYVNNKPDTKGTLLITVEGYRGQIKKAVTISTENMKPSLVQSRTSTAFSTLSLGAESDALVITNKASGETYDFVVAESTEGYVTVSEGKFVPELTSDYAKFVQNSKTTASIKLDVQADNWVTPITLTHKLSVSTKTPTVKCSAKSLTVNSVFDTTATAKLIPSAADCPVPVSYDIIPAKANQKENTDKLDVTIDGWAINVAIKDTSVKSGSYSYKVTPKISDDVSLKTITIKVVVENKLPAVKLNKKSSATVTLNSLVVGDSAVSALTISKEGYTYVSSRLEAASKNKLSADNFTLDYDEATRSVSVKIAEGKKLAKGSYAYNLFVTVRDDVTEVEKELAAAKVTIKVVNTAPVMKTSASGSVDLIRRDTGIVYAITGATNLNYRADEIDTITLTGADAAMFDISESYADAKGRVCVLVTPKKDVDFKASTTYKIALAVKFVNLEDAVETGAISVKTTQSALKLAVNGNLTAYLGRVGKTETITIRATSPAGAKIANATIDMDSIPAELKAGVTFNEARVDENGNVIINYVITDAAQLKVKKSYKFKVVLTPEGNATNKSGQTVTVTMKIAK